MTCPYCARFPVEAGEPTCGHIACDDEYLLELHEGDPSLSDTERNE